MRAEVRALFPGCVEGEELCSPEGAEPLHPDEEAHVARAVDKRRLEFALGRTCARRALARLGVSAPVLLANADRSVAWPEGVWGSITHADDYCAAIAARHSDVRGLGIDAERRERVHERLWNTIATERELAWLRGASDASESLLRAALLFSAKESFYKAQFCATRAWVGFHDVHLSVLDDGTFTVELLVDVARIFARGTVFSGRHVVLAHHVVTGLVIPA
jgi:4'-phosphopantetheinyl transferase EntD